MEKLCSRTGPDTTRIVSKLTENLTVRLIFEYLEKYKYTHFDETDILPINFFVMEQISFIQRGIAGRYACYLVIEKV